MLKIRRECKQMWVSTGEQCTWSHEGEDAENLLAYSEHGKEHNPAPAQWTVAYWKIKGGWRVGDPEPSKAYSSAKNTG